MSIQRMSDVADEIVTAAFEALQANDLAQARALLGSALGPFPYDPRLRVMSAMVARADGQPQAAMDHLWRDLAAVPADALCRAEVGFTVLDGEAAEQPPAKDFSLDSGERQTAREIAQIRADHRARNVFAARWLLQNHRARQIARDWMPFVGMAMAVGSWPTTAVHAWWGWMVQRKQ